MFDQLGNGRSGAGTLGKIGEILPACGEIDEALRTYREDETPHP